MSVSVLVSSFAGVDVGAKIAAAYASLPSQGGEIIVDLGGSFATGVVFGVSGKVARLKGFGNALGLTYSGTGPAFTFDNGLAFDFCSMFEELTLTGPGNSSGAVGLLVGGTKGAVGLTARNFLIQGFGVGLETRSNTWITRFEQGMIRDCQNLVLMPSGQSQAGQSVQFDHVTFADAPAPHTNAVLIQGGGQEVVFSACSFDHAQLRIGNGATSAAQCVASNCHFENPNFANPGAVDYDFVVVDNNNGNYLRLTDCYFMQDRSTGSHYSRFLFLQGGVVQMIGIGMFTPAGAPLDNFAVLANAVNVNLLGFNDLSGNIAGGLYGGSTTGFLLSLPGRSAAAISGFNFLIGAADLLGGNVFQFNVPVSVGTGAVNYDLNINGNLIVSGVGNVATQINSLLARMATAELNISSLETGKADHGTYTVSNGSVTL